MLKVLRESCNLTQRRLSLLTGIPRTTIYSLEQGLQKNPNPEKLDKIIECIADRTDLAYIAGLIDRSSYMSIYKHEPNKVYDSVERKHPHYVARFMTTSKHVEITQIIQKVLGTGSLSYIFGSHGNTRTKYYRWYASSKQAGDALEKVYPYLKIKREKAKVLLSFRDYLNENNYKHKQSGFDIEEHIRICDEYYKAIREID